MPQARQDDFRQAIVERNVTAILDGTQRVLEQGGQPNISNVATEAGVSRPTVYAHFHDRRRLLEALVERTVRRTMAAIELAEPERGPAAEALKRLIDASWQHLGRHEYLARVSAAELSSDAMRRAHETARAVIRKLVERGRREQAFRTDVPSEWLVTSSLALIHAAAEAVRAGELEADAALRVLTVSVGDLFEGRSDSHPAGA
jgi:TetR/AcrR family transcriptional regulator, mexCD-oprJ operon repressor